MERARQLDLVKKGIVTVDRPRLIEFYTIHCPACQSYKPIIEQCRQKYGETIDFQSVDFDDEKNIKLNIGLWVTAVPTTFVFNRRGEEVFEKTGCLDFATLDKQLRDPDLFK
jgi:thiol-disulfide isomerase/thioredoxin